jgi:hypothetical protein
MYLLETTHQLYKCESYKNESWILFSVYWDASASLLSNMKRSAIFITLHVMRVTTPPYHFVIKQIIFYNDYYITVYSKDEPLLLRIFYISKGFTPKTLAVSRFLLIFTFFITVILLYYALP